jgi:hypothetical protein
MADQDLGDVGIRDQRGDARELVAGPDLRIVVGDEAARLAPLEQRDGVDAVGAERRGRVRRRILRCSGVLGW